LLGSGGAEAVTPRESSSSSFVARVVRQVGPAVVHIETLSLRDALSPGFALLPPGGGGGLEYEDENEGDSSRVQYGQGSGVIIDSQGLVLTNHHVVKGSSLVMVTLADGSKFEGQVLGTDTFCDLAVVKILTGEGDSGSDSGSGGSAARGAGHEADKAQDPRARGLGRLRAYPRTPEESPKGDAAGRSAAGTSSGRHVFPVAALGDSSDLAAGDWVIAIGSPFGLENTVCARAF
jgi:S1-C subfamily serine protease